ncbi:MAG: penicillin-binding protein activator [Candidatus ainarchaeum sp.]|nr:penicillin-binding protein activator [Candidatus ainarchaeum sp.]
MQSGLKICFLACIALFSVLLILGCAQNPQQPSAKETIKVGILTPLSGARAEAGEYSKRGLDFAVQEINSDNSKKYSVELAFEDTQYDPKLAVTAFQKFRDIDGLKFVIGPYGSSEVLAIAPLAEQGRIILLTSSSQSTDVTNAGDYIFRSQISVGQEAPFWADFIYRKIGSKPLHLLLINTDYGESYQKNFVPAFEKLGGKIGVVEKFGSGDTDFRTALSKIKDSETGGILMVTMPKSAGLILKQAKEMGIETSFFASSVFEGQELFDAAGGAEEGIVYPYPYDVESADTAMKTYKEKYYAKYNEIPEMISANAHDALMLLDYCFEKTGNDVEKIKACLYSIKDFEGASGTITFDKNGDVTKPLIVKIVKNGKFVKYEE